MRLDVEGPHNGQPVLTAGTPLGEADAVAVLVHGRGGTAEEMLAFASAFRQPGVCYLAPQASAHTWYPRSFLEPLESNEPWLSSALAALHDVVRKTGLPAGRVMLLGFSQGACLALEYAARNPAPFGGLVGFSGGLIGPVGDPLTHEGSLEGVPVFLGCSDVDPHIPVERVRETAEVLGGMGASVETRIYPGMGHTVNDDEIAAARELMARVLQAG